MRILILNWRCPTNPRAGGAEILTFEIARRLVRRGDCVEWFAATYPGAPDEETLDGVNIVRKGHQWSVHWHAFRRYRKPIRERFDAVIDEVNTMPFFTPLWAGIPTFMLIFQLAREVWWYESPFPLNAVGYLLEPVYLNGYKHTPVLTISKSTEQDLKSLGFTCTITIIPIGIEAVVSTSHRKNATPTFLYVGRLAPSKRIGHMLEALARYRRVTGAGTLWLVGTGSDRYTQSLVTLAHRLQVHDSIVFWGRVSTEKKLGLMAEAHALLMTSVREGWGLVVTEASACGTPAIVYDVPGLRDSVRDESTGLVVQPGTRSLSEAMIRMTSDADLYVRMVTEGRRWSATFSFDEAARLVEVALDGTVAA